MGGKAKENVALIQGPPGTGKTSTVVGLVTALLNGNVPMPGGGKSKAGTLIQVGKTFTPTGGSSASSCNTSKSIQRRILVCAPSNLAVDDLAWRLRNSAIGPNGKVGGFNLVRFGVLPGEERHDGRGGRGLGAGKGAACRASANNNNDTDNDDRDMFLRRVNLDIMVEEMAKSREGPKSSEQIHKNNDEANTGQYQLRKSKKTNYTVERRKILNNCHIVCTTLSSSGSKAFAESCSRDDFKISEFDAVIIDEACQASESSCLIPWKYNPTVVVMVGDPQQLPVFVLSQSAAKNKFNRSLFQRLEQIKHPVDMLKMQYRMLPPLVQFPSMKFYNNQLQTSDTVTKRPPACWHSHACFPPLIMWDLVQGSVMQRGGGGGISNRAEIDFITKTLLSVEFSDLFINKLPSSKQTKKNTKQNNVTSIGIIAFYNEQVTQLKQETDAIPWLHSPYISLQISTVDGFQGAEKDIIILSCVRSMNNGGSGKGSNSIGFLSDYRRVNVALTRARQSLWIVGNCSVLSKDSLWKEIINDMYRRKLIARAEHFMHLATGKEIPVVKVEQQQQKRCGRGNSGGRGNHHGKNRAKKTGWHNNNNDDRKRKLGGGGDGSGGGGDGSRGGGGKKKYYHHRKKNRTN